MKRLRRESRRLLGGVLAAAGALLLLVLGGALAETPHYAQPMPHTVSHAG